MRHTPPQELVAHATVGLTIALSRIHWEAIMIEGFLIWANLQLVLWIVRWFTKEIGSTKAAVPVSVGLSLVVALFGAAAGDASGSTTGSGRPGAE